MIDTVSDFHREVTGRLDTLAQRAADGAFDPAVDLLVSSLDAGGVIQAFGTGHSEAFAMEIAGRAGGLIPTTRISLRDVVLHGDRPVADLEGATMERDPDVVSELLAASPLHPEDIFVIASNSGVNGSIVGLALAVKERGHKVIAVTSMEHTMAVPVKHPSGQRLADVADVVIDNLAPFGDATLTLGETYGVGAVSSLTAAFIAQALTLGVTERMLAAGSVPPLYISANSPGGDEHNHALEERYRGRIRRAG
ncbi:SIS domain-containing protein [Ruania suaedae]|uniref:sugar isomerase domain-containing protein n=1 Tax=Ruania suaedae TaxID=2897774 RepID=UPI001E290E01|nr:SIS domain-containing protein [Ruania suaedae]UFU04423.1 SIS domain-containing protein [Ruania suaedae]